PQAGVEGRRTRGRFAPSSFATGALGSPQARIDLTSQCGPQGEPDQKKPSPPKELIHAQAPSHRCGPRTSRIVETLLGNVSLHGQHRSISPGNPAQTGVSRA